MSIETAESLTINDVLATNMTELCEEELLSVYGGSFGSYGAAGVALGATVVAFAPYTGPAAPVVASFGVGLRWARSSSDSPGTDRTVGLGWGALTRDPI